MILVDTSVWVDFLRGSARAARLPELLEHDLVASHPGVVGELAMGHLGAHRKRLLADLEMLPSLETVPHAEVLRFVEARELFGRGLGWIDANLLASILVAGATLWTFDRTLHGAAERLGVDADV